MSPAWLESRGGRALGSLLGTLVLALAALPVAHVERAEASRAAFDPRPWQQLVEQQPEFVFIGNSMLYSRLDEDLLAEGLGGPAAFLVDGGAMSAQWYLRLVALVDTGLRPRRVVVTFRDEFLTRAAMRTDGTYRQRIEALCNRPDPLLESLIGELGSGGGDGLPAWLEPRSLRTSVEDLVDGLADDLAADWRPDSTREERKALVNGVFAVDKLRGDLQLESAGLDYGPDAGSFAEQVERSFLPAMLEVAREADLPLSFVRVQRRQRLEDGADGPALAAYLADLRRFVEAGGAALIDMNGEPGVTADLYGEGDHIADDRRADYTRLFLELHGEALRSAHR